MSEVKKHVKPIRILGFAALALLLVTGIFIAVRYANMRVKTASMPAITILAPVESQPARMDLVNPIRVQAAANGQGLTSLEWYLDGALFGSVQGDEDILNAEWQWLPDHEGTYQLSFLAYAENGAMGLASMDVAVLSGADVDADGVADTQDECPSEPGPEASAGCLLTGDDDQDGLVGEADLCPDAAGTAAFSGCPAGLAPDRDTDGLFDTIDRCPDESGLPDWDGCPISAWSINSDGDELPDFLDDCPRGYGPRDAGGCPLPTAGDTDGDTVADAEDICADSPGTPEDAGCPLAEDRDRDGISDVADSCPDEAGIISLDGCPPGASLADLDLDAVFDAFDICPELPGLLDLCGCPMPADHDGDGITDAEDHCPDLSGSPAMFGCPLATFPFAEYQAQFDFLPSIPRFGEKGDDDIIFAQPERIASIIETSAYPPQPDDQDGDGVLNDEDLCDNQIGRPLNNGCPFLNDWDSDGKPDAIDTCMEFNGSCQSADDIRKVGFTLKGFRSDPSWSGVYCYGWTNGEYHYKRTPYWNHEEPVFLDPETTFLGIGYRFIPANSYISLSLHCWGQPEDLTRHSQYLGQIQLDYHEFFWDGQIRKLRAYGPGGMFEIWVILQQVSYAITS